MATNTITMRIVNTCDLPASSQIASLEREVRWYNSEIQKLQEWLNNPDNKMRGTYEDVVKRSRGLQFELRDKEELLNTLQQSKQ